MIRAGTGSIIRWGAVATLLLAWALPAEAVVIDASDDIWIRESQPSTTYPNDFISVWGTGDIRHGVVEFDLSSIVGQTITSAYVKLFDSGGVHSQTQPIVQQGYVIGTTPPEIQNYTWEEYTMFDLPTESAFTNLGSYNIPLGEHQGGYNSSDLASAGDISLLNTVRNSNNNRVVFIFKATDGQRDWLDIERNAAPQLVINQPLPVFGDLDGDGTFDEEDLDVITDPNNWLQTVPVGSRGDISGSGRVDLEDFHVFKEAYLESQTGSGSAVVPEPSALALGLIAAGLASLLCVRRVASAEHAICSAGIDR